MRNIVIADGGNTVTLSKDLVFTLTPQTVGSTATMVSGKTVKDITGTKDTLEVPIGWLAPAELVKLKGMIDSGQPLTVTYPGVGGTETGEFYIAQPTYKTCRYTDDGVDIWLGVTLRMEMAGVK